VKYFVVAFTKISPENFSLVKKGTLQEYRRHFLMILIYQLIRHVLNEVLDKRFSEKRNTGLFIIQGYSK